MELAAEIFKTLIHVVPETGCWEYGGAKDSHGYGRIFIGGRERKAQRIAYELLMGPLPDRARLRHHLGAGNCIGAACCNPVHLRPMLRLSGVAAYKSGACKHGHPLTAANVVIENRKGALFKRCRTCRREAWKGWRASQRSKP